MAEIDQNKPVVVDHASTEDGAVHVVIPPRRPRKVNGGMWGTPEIGAVSAAALALLMAAVAYFFWAVPSGRELAKNRAEADRLEVELLSARSKYGQITSTETEVARIVTSVDDFETRFLPVSTTGQSALYQRLNGLIRAYGLTNTTGPDYAPLDPGEMRPGDDSEEQKGRAKFRSLYPGVYVSTTLEGSYQNLRRFIREIETGREFIVVSAVELAPSDSDKQGGGTDSSGKPASNTIAIQQNGGAIPTGRGGAVQPGFQPNNFGQQPERKKRVGKMHGEVVSLHIEMAAYFRRPNFVPQMQEQQQ